MKRIAILGSTGSIGQNALKVIEHIGAEVTALSARSNIDLLELQIEKFRPQFVAVWDEKKAFELQKRLPGYSVLAGQEGVCSVAAEVKSDLLLNAISGFEGVLPTLRAIKSGKKIALANKEALVAAGGLILELSDLHQSELIPVDSEHTAIFQCLKGEKLSDVRRIILTASGGPFWQVSRENFKKMGLKEALKHPNYTMGPKVTIDSSTMMNKGLEMIETHFLYRIPLEQIEVVIHPEQIIHSMVEFSDLSIMAQMGEPDMTIPLQVALTHPDRSPPLLKPFDFHKTHSMQFFPCVSGQFPCLDLAYASLRAGGSMPCFMNAANEVLVGRFLKGEIDFGQIGDKLEKLMDRHLVESPTTYEELAAVDGESRQLARGI